MILAALTFYLIIVVSLQVFGLLLHEVQSGLLDRVLMDTDMALV